MKLIISFVLLTLLAPQWGHDFDAAKKTAKEKNELILLNFSGSDWCGPCIALRKEFFESKAFADIAGNLVLVNADFPRKKKNMPAADIVEQNEQIADIYNKDGAFPLTLLLDPDGKVIKQWRGKPETTAEKWCAEIKTLCDARK